MIAYSIQRYKQHPRISIYISLIVSFALILAFCNSLQEHFKSISSIPGAFICSTIGYTLRPACIYLFILMTYQKRKGQLFYLTAIPIAVTFFVYMLGIIPGIQEYTVHFVHGDDGMVHWVGGGFLRWTSHLVGLGYLIWIIYISFSILKLRHLSHGITILTCALFVILAVVFESLFNNQNNVQILNPTIAVSAMIYYLYLYIERNQIDTLTNCYTRETYYHDLPKMKKSVTGVIQFDMNGLKYLNDNIGHAEGDLALSTIGSIIIESAKRKMYVYRLGGDEFLLLANNTSEEELLNTIEKFKQKISETKYHCSVGYSYRSSSSVSIDDMLKESEARMYEDKAEYYKNSNFERRKV